MEQKHKEYLRSWISTLKKYAENNGADFSEKEFAEQSLIYFNENGYVLDILIDWKSGNIVENLERSKLKDDDIFWIEWSIEDFIKNTIDFMKQFGDFK